jgi:DNA-binding NtrC family response regulator
MQGMEDPVWAVLLRPEHPWNLGGPLCTALADHGDQVGLSIATIFSSAWAGDVAATIERLQVEDQSVAPEVRVLLWAGLALQVRLNDAAGSFRYCLARCRVADELRTSTGLRVLAGLLEGHWNAARRQQQDQNQRLGEVLTSGRLVDHHQVLQLALRGLASPLLHERALLARIAPNEPNWCERIRFYDAVECGRVAEAAALAGRSALHATKGEEALIRAYTAITWLQQAVLGRHRPDPVRTLDGPSAPWRHIGATHLEQSVRSSFISVFGNSDEINHLGAGAEVTDEQLFTPSGHFAAIPIRLALAQGKPERAAALLARRRAAGVVTYLDRVLELRRLHQQGDRAAASVVGAAIARDIEAYDCRGRIEFELRAAQELSLVDLLGCSAQSEPTVSVSVSKPSGLGGLVGASTAMDRVRAAVSRFAAVDLPVLIRGPSGTGKDLVARALHETSPRKNQPFIAVNCAALAEGLLESELFGHAKGAFSGAATTRGGLVAAAGEGTLFLDEIGEISRHFQAALLRLLETGDYRPVGADTARTTRCRIIAATNADLAQCVADGSFREDLYHRLCRLEITLPSLVEHLEDLPDLVAHLVIQARGGRAADIDSALITVLRQRSWSGNVRELRNRLEAMVVLHPHMARYGVREFCVGDGHVAAVASPVAVFAPADDRPETGKQHRLVELESLLHQRGKLTRVEVARALQVSSMTATTYLRELCQRGVARKVMPNAAPRSHYFVSVSDMNK